MRSDHDRDEEKADTMGDTPRDAAPYSPPINNVGIVNTSVNATTGSGSRQQRAERGISQLSDVDINLAFGAGMSESLGRNLNRVNMPSGGPTCNSNIQSNDTVVTVNTLNTLNTVNTMNTMNSGTNGKLDSLNSMKANHPSINIGNSNSNISNYNYVDYNRGTMSKIDETAYEFDFNNNYNGNTDIGRRSLGDHSDHLVCLRCFLSWF